MQVRRMRGAETLRKISHDADRRLENVVILVRICRQLLKMQENMFCLVR